MDALRDAGFSDLAELLYMERTIRTWKSARVTLPGTLVTYSDSRHALFAQTILKSYEHTLDCPALSGIRHIDDIIASHQAAGDFDPHWWSVLMTKDVPTAVLLLSPYQEMRTVELVYLGIAPESRGQGIGRALLQHAIWKCATERYQKLTLAVDSNNAPAMRLYASHGLKQTTSRRAMIRVLGGGSTGGAKV